MASAAGGDGNAGPRMSGVEARRRRGRLWRRRDRHVGVRYRVWPGYVPGRVTLSSVTTAGPLLLREFIGFSRGVTEIPGRRRYGRDVVGGIEKGGVRAGDTAVGATTARESCPTMTRRRRGRVEGW